MIDYKQLNRPDLRKLEHTDYSDYKRVVELYDKWDVAASNKDFHNAEHYDYMIKKIFVRNGIKEK